MEKEIEVGNNRLIAEFMGWKFVDVDNSADGYPDSIRVTTLDGLEHNDPKECVESFLLHGLAYHEDWRELMPVVEKIGDTRLKATASYNPDLMFKVEICNGYTKIEGTHQVIFHNASKDGMLTATYKAVLQFIQWYNEQNK